MTTTTSIVIARPPADDVFAYVTDPTHFHQWQQGVGSGGMQEPGTPPSTHARSSVSIDVDFEGHGMGKLLVTPVVRRQAAKGMPANIARGSRTGWSRAPPSGCS